MQESYTRTSTLTLTTISSSHRFLVYVRSSESGRHHGRPDNAAAAAAKSTCSGVVASRWIFCLNQALNTFPLLLLFPDTHDAPWGEWQS